MEFQIWKVERLAGENPSWFTFSIRTGEETPIILDQRQFSKLFPTIDLETVPIAPLTKFIEIQARMLEVRIA